MSTPAEKVAETMGRAVDGSIFRLEQEREELLRAPARIAEIDAELAELRANKVEVDKKRPKKESKGVDVLVIEK